MADPQEIDFYCTAVTGKMSVLDRYLEQNPNNGTLLASQAFAGHTILHAACLMGKLELVRAFLQRQVIRDALIDARDINQGRTPLHQVVVALDNHGCDELFHILVQAGSNVLIPDSKGRTALHTACDLGRPLVWIQALLEACDSGPRNPVHLPDKAGKTPLHLAAEACRVDVVELLLQWDRKFSQSVKAKTTPPAWYWIWCSSLNHVNDMDELEFQAHLRVSLHVHGRILRRLLTAGLSIWMVGEPKRKEQIISSRELQWHDDHWNLLCRLEDDPLVQIFSAVARNDVREIQKLTKGVDNDSSVSFKKSADYQACLWASALGHACEYGNFEMAVYLMEDAPVPIPLPLALMMDIGDTFHQDHQQTCARMTPLQVALQFGNFEIVKEMIRRSIT